MAASLRKVVQGALVAPYSSQPNTKEQAQHVVHGNITRCFKTTIAVDHEILLCVAQADMTIKAAYVVPGVTSAANATNYVTLDLGKADLANGALTSFDSFTTASVALTISTSRAFTIVESTDTLATGDGLYLHVTNTAAGIATDCTIVVEYELTD